MTRGQRAALYYVALMTVCFWLAMTGILGRVAQPVTQEICTADTYAECAR